MESYRNQNYLEIGANTKHFRFCRIIASGNNSHSSNVPLICGLKMSNWQPSSPTAGPAANRTIPIQDPRSKIHKVLNQQVNLVQHRRYKQVNDMVSHFICNTKGNAST